MEDPREKCQDVLPVSPLRRLLILALLAVSAVVSTCVGVKEGLTNGIDLQWSGAHLLVHHQDPWRTFLSGDPGRRIILGQQPNYLAEFYVLLAPLGRMTFEHARAIWCAVNLALLAGVLLLMRRIFALDRDHFVFLTLLVFSSAPFRVTLSNGQNGIFTLFLLILTFHLRGWFPQGMALGVSFSKYSFSPVIALLLLLKKRFRLVAVSAIPVLAGLIVAWWLVGGNLWALAFEPFATSRIAMGPGAADVMTALEIPLRSASLPTAQVFMITAVSGLALAFMAAIWICRKHRGDAKLQLALALVVTLLCTKHVIYDFVVLLVPAAVAIASRKSRARTVVLLCTAHFWFVSSVVSRIFGNGPYLPKVVIYAVILLCMALATSRLEFASSHSDSDLRQPEPQQAGVLV